MLFLFANEEAAREIFFGLVFSNALLTFAPARVHRLAIPVFVAVLVLLTLVSAGILPTMTFY